MRPYGVPTREFSNPTFTRAAICFCPIKRLPRRTRKPGRADLDQPIYGKKPLGLIKYSDSLLMFLLRGLRPERYRERTEVTGKDGGPIDNKLEIVFVKSPAPLADSGDGSSSKK